MTELIPASEHARNYRHGYKTAGRYSTEYAIWNGMRARCHNPNNPNFQRYGARGITVCDAWRSDFLMFLNDMGRRPSARHTLDRVDNDGNYTPENCRWATLKDQCRNRRSSRFLTANGETKTQAEWSEISGVSQGTLHSRLKSGWSADRAVTTPVRGKASKDGITMFNAVIHKTLPF